MTKFFFLFFGGLYLYCCIHLPPIVSLTVFLSFLYRDERRENTNPFSSIVFHIFGNSTDSQGCVTDGLLANVQFKTFTPNCLSRNFNSTALPLYPSIFFDAFAWQDVEFVAFSKRLEALHMVLHYAMGGDMSTTHSPLDPMFFVHHAFSDKIWSDHQVVLHTQNLSQYTGFDKAGNEVSLTDTGAAFDGLMVRDVLDTRNLCYIYADTDNGTTMPTSVVVSSPPSSGSPYLSPSQTSGSIISVGSISTPTPVSSTRIPFTVPVLYANGSISSSSLAYPPPMSSPPTYIVTSPLSPPAISLPPHHSNSNQSSPISGVQVIVNFIAPIPPIPPPSTAVPPLVPQSVYIREFGVLISKAANLSDTTPIYQVPVRSGKNFSAACPGYTTYALPDLSGYHALSTLPSPAPKGSSPPCNSTNAAMKNIPINFGIPIPTGVSNDSSISTLRSYQPASTRIPSGESSTKDSDSLLSLSSPSPSALTRPILLNSQLKSSAEKTTIWNLTPIVGSFLSFILSLLLL